MLTLKLGSRTCWSCALTTLQSFLRIQIPVQKTDWYQQVSLAPLIIRNWHHFESFISVTCDAEKLCKRDPSLLDAETVWILVRRTLWSVRTNFLPLAHSIKVCQDARKKAWCIVCCVWRIIQFLRIALTVDGVVPVNTRYLRHWRNRGRPHFREVIQMKHVEWKVE